MFFIFKNFIRYHNKDLTALPISARTEWAEGAAGIIWPHLLRQTQPPLG